MTSLGLGPHLSPSLRQALSFVSGCPMLQACKVLGKRDALFFATHLATGALTRYGGMLFPSSFCRSRDLHSGPRLV